MPQTRPNSNLLDDAEDGLARLDERLRMSPIRAGWIARTHLTDAAASVFLDGDHVALDDLVLHDCAMDVRTPTHALTRAQMMLSARRRIAGAAPGWGFEPGAEACLRGVRGSDPTSTTPNEPAAAEVDAQNIDFGEIDALIARTTRLLDRDHIDIAGTMRSAPSPKSDRLAEWRDHLAASQSLSPVAAAAAVGCAWDELRPIDDAGWLGRLFAAEVLRVRGKTRSHLLPLSLGLKGVARADRQSRDPKVRRCAWIQGVILAVETGLRDHDRWLTAEKVLMRKLKGRRSTSSLPGLVALVLRHPLVTSAMIAKELGVSQRAAQDLCGQLGLREMTGRGRYRAWGIL